METQTCGVGERQKKMMIRRKTSIRGSETQIDRERVRERQTDRARKRDRQRETEDRTEENRDKHIVRMTDVSLRLYFILLNQNINNVTCSPFSLP